MDKLEMHSMDKAQEHTVRLRELFPNCVTEAKGPDGRVRYAVDFDMLRQELSDVVVEGSAERYQFTWPDKRRSVLAATAPITKTLRPCRKESVDFDTTENLYIEGDNLDALKLLQKSYLGKVKLIYIDPPYNTGKDYIYEDDFAESAKDYMLRSGDYDEDGNRLVKNLDSEGRFHTKWLNMIYPRLKLAKDLLAEDGSIFVSIDFNEAGNLRKLMDEIFGAQNFQREIIWRIGWLSGFKTMAPNFIRNHDTILYYSRNPVTSYFDKKYIENKNFKPLVKKDAQLARKLAELGLDERRQKELLDFINHGNRPERYPIEDTWNANEYDDLNSIAIVSFSGEKVSKLLDIDQDFKGQKSVKMLMRIIEATTGEGDIVMDFFSGTASTAHAVMQCNAEDGMHRRFIMVQLPESTGEAGAAYQAGYRTLCEIGKERIRSAGASLKGGDLPAAGDLDTGFRVLKVDSTNMRDVYYAPAALRQSDLLAMVDNIKSDRTEEDLLFQILLDLGIPLSGRIERAVLGGKTVYSVADGYLLACFDSGVSDEVVTEAAKRRPYYFVMRDSSLAGDATAANFDQIFETYSPSTVRKVL